MVSMLLASMLVFMATQFDVQGQVGVVTLSWQYMAGMAVVCMLLCVEQDLLLAFSIRGAAKHAAVQTHKTEIHKNTPKTNTIVVQCCVRRLYVRICCKPSCKDDQTSQTLILCKLCNVFQYRMSIAIRSHDI